MNELLDDFEYVSRHHEVERGPFRATTHRAGTKHMRWHHVSVRMLINLRPSKAEADIGGGVIALEYEDDRNYVSGHTLSAQLYLGNGRWVGWRFSW